jgi:hypothetical protein
MITQNLTNKWLNYPWLPNQGLDHVIHPDDLDKLKGQGIGLLLCIEDAGGAYIMVKNKVFTGRVMRSGVKSIFPPPAYLWDQAVKIKSKPLLPCFIKDFFWHHKDEKYFYRLVVEQKVGKKRYSEDEIDFL